MTSLNQFLNLKYFQRDSDAPLLETARARAIQHQRAINESLSQRFGKITASLYPSLDSDIQTILSHFNFFVELSESNYFTAFEKNKNYFNLLSLFKDDQAFYAKNRQSVDFLCENSECDDLDGVTFLNLCRAYVAHFKSTQSFDSLLHKIKGPDRKIISETLSKIRESKDSLMAAEKTFSEKIKTVQCWDDSKDSFFPVRNNKIACGLNSVFDPVNGIFADAAKGGTASDNQSPNLWHFAFSPDDYDELLEKSIKTAFLCDKDKVDDFFDAVREKLIASNTLPNGFSDFQKDQSICHLDRKDNAFYGTDKPRGLSTFFTLLETALDIPFSPSDVDSFETSSVCKFRLPEALNSDGWLTGFIKQFHFPFIKHEAGNIRYINMPTGGYEFGCSDCSSFVSELLKASTFLDRRLTTRDLYLHHKAQESRVYVTKSERKTSDDLSHYMVPVSWSDVQPGDVYLKVRGSGELFGLPLPSGYDEGFNKHHSRGGHVGIVSERSWRLFLQQKLCVINNTLKPVKVLKDSVSFLERAASSLATCLPDTVSNKFDKCRRDATKKYERLMAVKNGNQKIVLLERITASYVERVASSSDTRVNGSSFFQSMASKVEEFKSWLSADVAHISLNRNLEANGSEGYLEQRVPSKVSLTNNSESIKFFRFVPKESLLGESLTCSKYKKQGDKSDGGLSSEALQCCIS